MSTTVGLLKRVGLAVVVAGLVVLGALFAGALLAPPGGISPGADHPEYAASELDTDRLGTAGTPDPDAEVGTVVFDRTQNNRFDQEDVAPLADAITRAGGEVRYPPMNADLQTSLANADVLVIIDPANEYDQNDLDAIQQFLDAGGKLVIFGEPNQNVVQQGEFGAALTTQRSHLTTLGSTFGISFGTEYLYDQEHNDGNFKNVLVEPSDEAGHALVDGVNDVALYTSTSVSIRDGTVLLRTSPTAKQADTPHEDGYPVAVLNDEETVLAVGDTTFLQSQYASVGDNDVFVTRIVEFMAGGDPSPAGGNGDDQPPVGDDPPANESDGDEPPPDDGDEPPPDDGDEPPPDDGDEPPPDDGEEPPPDDGEEENQSSDERTSEDEEAAFVGSPGGEYPTVYVGDRFLSEMHAGGGAVTSLSVSAGVLA